MKTVAKVMLSVALVACWTCAVAIIAFKFGVNARDTTSASPNTQDDRVITFKTRSFALGGGACESYPSPGIEVQDEAGSVVGSLRPGEAECLRATGSSTSPIYWMAQIPVASADQYLVVLTAPSGDIWDAGYRSAASLDADDWNWCESECS